MNLKNLLEAMASQLEGYAALQQHDGQLQPSHAWAEQLSNTATALRDAATRVNPEVIVRPGEPD